MFLFQFSLDTFFDNFYSNESIAILTALLLSLLAGLLLGYLLRSRAVRRLRDTIAEKDRQILEWDKQYQALEEQFALKEADLKKANNEIDELTARLHKIEHEKVQLNQRMTTVYEELSEASNTAQTYATTIEDLNTQILSLKSKNIELEGNITEYESERQEANILKSTFDSTNEQIEQLELKINRLQQENEHIEQLELKLNRLQQENDLLKGELDRINEIEQKELAHTEATEQKIGVLENKLAALHTENTNLKNFLDQLRQDTDELIISQKMLAQQPSYSSSTNVVTSTTTPIVTSEEQILETPSTTTTETVVTETVETNEAEVIEEIKDTDASVATTNTSAQEEASIDDLFDENTSNTSSEIEPSANGSEEEMEELSYASSNGEVVTSTTTAEKETYIEDSVQTLPIGKDKEVLRERFEVEDAIAIKKDDLTLIDGIGPFLQQQLNDNGIYTFEDIALLHDEDIKMLTEQIGYLPGRIEKDNWVGQAQDLVKDKRENPLNFSRIVTEPRKEDDLKVIEGIGPKVEQLLKKSGILSLQTLSRTSPDLLQKILEGAGEGYHIYNPKTWPKQAELAAAGDWDALQTYQDTLINGEEM